METADYISRVHAGVLGKIIGVYMGRPFEGWTHQQILDRFGEVFSYVNQDAPLVLTDDDIAGTFTFVRAIEDYGFDTALSAEAIGQTWLNYLVYKRTILWWGGLGNSTEHTAYLRLRDGIKAPASGSISVNGKTTANQIGAQIFIDGWALVSPGNPDQAADLARKAASVSHDGEAVNAAIVIAVLEARAFIESDMDRLLDGALSHIAADSIIARLIAEIRVFHRRESDWRAARAWLDEVYGYDSYRGNCHVVPNFALIILGLLYGEGDFRASMMIVNTSGRDTDCNAGTLGCILGIRNGLAAIEACPDLRAPHRDLLYLPSADGGRCVSDALREAYYLANVHFRMTLAPEILPKASARYHFSLPGALHAFRALEGPDLCQVRLRNSLLPGMDARGLELALEERGLALVATPVFSTESRIIQYETQASPALYPGQTVAATLIADANNRTSLACRIFVNSFASGDRVLRFFGPLVHIGPGESSDLTWKLNSGIDGPIVDAGIAVDNKEGASARVWLDRMTWTGAPDCSFKRRGKTDQWWKHAWVNGVDEWGVQFPESYRLSQNQGTGLIIQGTREWGDYEASAIIIPFQSSQVGLAVRVQGMRRYYALVLRANGLASLIRERDGTHVIASASIAAKECEPRAFAIRVAGKRIVASIDGEQLFDVQDGQNALETGAVGLLVTEGTLSCDEVRVSPIESL